MSKNFSFETQPPPTGVGRSDSPNPRLPFFIRKFEVTGLKRKIQIKLKNFLRERVSFVDLICELCQQLIIDPIFTLCGHLSCRKCLIEQLSFKKECPACKKFLGPKDCFRDPSIQPRLYKIIKNLEPCALFEYSLRERAHRIWRNKIVIKELKVGQQIDYLDDLGEWRQGFVLRLFKRKKSRKHRLIVASLDHSLVDTVTTSGTNVRVAPLGFMTEPNCYQINKSTLPSEKCPAVAGRFLPQFETLHKH